MDREKLIEEQLKIVKEAILIDDIIGGDGSEIYVEFKGRSSRFSVNEELASNINKWLDDLPVVTVEQLSFLMKKRNVTLSLISEILEDDELIKIENIVDWVNVYNEQDNFLPIDVIDRMVEVNL